MVVSCGEHNESKYSISLLIPTYNSSATLGNTLDSIRKQLFTSVEVIIIDGGSADSTLQIASEYRDLITVILSEPDKGIYDAINKGIGFASGDLIGVIGSDDELCLHALESIFLAWSSCPSDIVVGQTILVSPDGTEVARVDEDYGLGALLSGIPFGHNAMFVTPHAYKKVGAYNIDYKICADADWVHRSISLGCTCEQIDSPIVRFGLEGLSSTNPNQIMMETYLIISKNFNGLNLTDAEGLFRAVRGWSDGSDVDSVFNRYKNEPNIIKAYDEAIKSREKRRSRNALSSQAISKPSGFISTFHRTLTKLSQLITR